jgi:tellurite resistance protein
MNPEHGTLNPKSARLFCRLAASMVVSDDDFSDREREFVDRVLTRFQVPETEWDAIYPLLEADEAAAELSQLSESEQRIGFATLIEAALVDGVLAASEREFLLTVGQALKLDSTALDNQLSAAARL